MLLFTTSVLSLILFFISTSIKAGLWDANFDQNDFMEWPSSSPEHVSNVKGIEVAASSSPVQIKPNPIDHIDEHNTVLENKKGLARSTIHYHTNVKADPEKYKRHLQRKRESRQRLKEANGNRTEYKVLVDLQKANKATTAQLEKLKAMKLKFKVTSKRYRDKRQIQKSKAKNA